MNFELIDWVIIGVFLAVVTIANDMCAVLLILSLLIAVPADIC